MDEFDIRTAHGTREGLVHVRAEQAESRRRQPRIGRGRYKLSGTEDDGTTG